MSVCLDWRLLITTLIYLSQSIVCLSSIEGFWLPLWYIQAFLLSVCRPLEASDYYFGIFKPFYCLSVVHWRLLITTLVYSSLSIVCLSSIEGFWLPLWYTQALLLSVCRRLKASDYHFGIFKPFYCLTVVDWRLLITTLVYSSLSIVCLSSIEGFWLPLWYTQAFLLSVCRPLKASDYHFGILKPCYCLSVVDWKLLITTLVYSSLFIVYLSRLKASDYHFGIFKPFYCLSVVHWRLLITTLVYSNLSIVCLSSIEGFWLPLWYIQAFLLSVCRPLKASDYHFGIFKPFYCLSVVDWRLLITTLVYSSLSIVCLSRLKASDYHFDIFKPFYCLSVVDWRLLITTSVYSSLSIVCLSFIEGFWLPLWYIQAFLLSVCRRLKASDYHFDIFKPFYCLSVVDWRLLITTLVYSSLSIVCLSSIEGFWLPLWYIQAFLLSVCRRLKASDYRFGIFKPFYCLSVVDWRLLITTLVYSSLSIVCLSSIEGFWLALWYIQAFLLSVCCSLKASDYHFDIFKPFYCLSVVDWRLLITTLVYSSLSIVCLTSIEGFWLPLWYTQAFLLSVCRPLKASDYHFGILKPCYCLSVVDWRLLITTLVYSSLSIVCLSRLKASDYHFDIFKPIYCLSVVDWRLLITTLVYSSLSIVCLSSIEGFWLLLWYIQAFLLSVCRSLKASDYHFGIFKPFYCLSVVHWRLLITTLVYSSPAIVCLSSIEGFWLPLWYIQAFLLSDCRRLKASDYHFGILKPFYCLSVVHWRLLITTLVYSSLAIVCLSSIEGFWLPLWYIQAFLLSVCRRLKASDYHFGIFKPLYCLSVVHWRLLITTLVYSSLSIVCLSFIEGFWLPLWYIQAFLLSDCRRLKASDYHFGIFKPFYCLSVVDWRLLITTLVYSSLSIVCLSSIEGFWLPLWYIQAFLLSVCRRLKASDYHFGIFKPFYCLSVVHWRLLITTLVYSSLAIVCLSSIEGFWLPLWYIQAFLMSVCLDWRLLITTLIYSSLSIVYLSSIEGFWLPLWYIQAFLLSVCRPLKASDYYFGIFKPFYCLSVVDWRFLITIMVYSSLSIVCLSVVHWRLLITTLVYSSLSIVCLLSIEGFWLPLWYIQAFLLSVCRRLKASDYHFGIFKPFYCLSVVHWRLLITTLVYSSLSIVCLSSIEGFWLPLWYIQAFLLSVCRRLKASDYHFGIFKPFYCLSVVDWRLLITTLVYSSLSIVCLSSIDGFWFPLRYIQAFLLSVCRRLKASDYHFGIFKPFYCLSVVHWTLLITTLVYSSLSIVCLSSIEGFWLPLWYIQAFLLSVCRRLKASDYHFGIFKPFYCLSVVHWRLLITTLVYSSLAIVCLSSIEGFWLPLWYIQAFLMSVCLDWRLLITTLIYSSLSIVCLSSIEGFWLPLWYIQAFLLSVCRPLKASDYYFGIFKPFYCLSVVDWRFLITIMVYSSLSIVCLSVVHWRLLITTLVYSSLSIVCLLSIEGFWLPLWYIQAFLLSVCRRLKASDYHFGIFKPFYCLSVVHWRLLITTLVYSSLSIVCLSSIEGFWLPLWYIQAFLLSVCRRLKASDYHFGIFKPFYCLSVVDWRLLITTLVYSSLSIVCLSSIDGFWFPLRYIQAFLLSVCRRLKASDYHFGIFKPFYCLSVVHWTLLITTLVYSSLSIVCLSSIEGFWLPLWYIQAFLLSVCLDWRLLITTLIYSSLSIVCLSSIEGFWLPLRYIQAFLLSVCRSLKASDYHFGIFKPFYCLTVVDWRLLITTLLYSSLSIVSLSSIEGFWLPLWYIQAFLLSVCRRLKASDYHFGIFKPLYCLSVVHWRFLITTLVYSSLSIVCLSSIEGFWLPLWYIQAFLLSVCRRLKASDYHFGIFKPFYCLSVVHWRLLITTLIYSSLSIVCLSSIEGFWLPLWYIQAFLLSVCRRLKASDYHFGILKPCYCLSVVDWRLLITTLVYSSLSIVCLSRLKASDYHFGIFKPFCCLSVVHSRLLITTLVYSSLSIVCLSSIEGFWLPLWYIQAFLLSLCRRLKVSDYHYGIFKPFYCLSVCRPLKASDYHFGIFKPFYCLSVVHWRLLITTLIYSSLSIVCLSSIESFWLPLWYIQAFLLSVCRPLKASDYYFGIFKPFYCLSVVDWRLLITTLVYSSLSIVCLSSIEGFWLPLWYIQAFLLSVCRRLKASDYYFGIFKPFYCLSVVHWWLLISTSIYSSLSIVCLSSIEGFWLPLWYIQAFLLSVCRPLNASDYHFGIFKPFYCLSVVNWRLLITTLVYSSLSIVCLSRLTASDYHFDIFKPFYCLSVVDWRLLITTSVYSSLSIVCLSFTEGFWLPLWYIQAFLLSDCRRLKASDYHFVIFKPFYCLSVVDWRLLITTLVYSSLSIVCLSSIEGFWLPLWYIQAFILSVCRPLKVSYYHFGIFKPFYCLSVVDWRLLITTLVYSSLSIVCLSSIEGFWLPLWYIQAFLLSVCRPLKASDYHFDIFKPFYCLSVVDWRLLITTLVYSSLSIVCLSSIEGFWLPLWYTQALLLSVCRRLKASDYHFGIFKPFYCLSVSIEGFWLPLWYIQAFLLSVCCPFEASDYHFGILKPFYCLSVVDSGLLITTLVYSSFSIVCLLSIEGFWLPLWYIQAFLLSVCRRLKASDYHFGIFKLFYSLSVVHWRLLITTLVYSSLSIVWLSSHWRLLITTLVYSSLSIVCLSSIEGFWLPLWYIQAFLLSVCRRLKASDYHFGIFKPFYCLSVVHWRLLITTLIYSSLSIVCLSSIEGFWLPLWYIQAFLLSVCRPLKASDYHFGIFKPCYCLSVVDWRLLITTLVYSSLSNVCLSRLKASDYHFDIFKPFYCLSVVDWRFLITIMVYSSLSIVCLSVVHWRLLITTLIYSSLSIVCLSSIEGFWLPLWYIQAFLLSVCRRLKASDYHFGILKPCYCLSVVDWRLLITTLVYSSLSIVCLSRLKASDYHFGIFKHFCCLSVVHSRLLITTLVYSSLSIVCLSSIEGFWLPLWYIQAFLLSLCRRLKVSDYHYGIFKPFYCLSVCRPLKASDYHFGIFKPFYCLSVVHWRLLITTLIYSSLSIVCLSSIESFWLPLWYIQAFLLSVCRPLKASDYYFGIFKPFYCLSVVDWRLLITTLVYSSLSIVCLSSIEGFWLPLWYIQAFLLSVCRRLKASDYHFGIFKPFYCLSVVHWRLLITTLIYSSLSIVCLSSIEGFWLPLWYIQAFLLSVCRPLKASDYHFGIFKPCYCLSVVDWRLLITTLVYSSLSNVCLSRLKASDYHFDIFKPFYCLSVVDWRFLITIMVYSSLSIVCLSVVHWRLLITTLIYSSLSIVCLSSIEGFWLPLWYIQAFLLSVCRRLKASDYHFGILKPCYCLSVVDWRLLITTLVYSSLSIVCLSRLKASDYHFGIFKHFCCLSVVHSRLLITTLVYSSLSIVCLSSIEGFWLPLWYIQAFLLSLCRRLKVSDYHYGIFKPFYCLSVCRPLKASDYHFGIFKPFYCLSVVHWRLLITTLIYSSLSIVCLSSIESFWLPLWYIQAFLLSVCRPLKASDYYFGIFKPFYCLSVVDWRLLITTLVYSSLSIVCLSSIEGFWLPLWYIQAFLLSVCRRLKASDYYFGIFKPFYCLSVVHWWLLISTSIYSSLSIVCLSSIEGFWLPLWYIQAFLLSVCRPLNASDYHFGIFKPFYCLSVVNWRLLITTLVYSSLSIVCLSRLTASDYHFDIFKPFYCLSVVDWRLLITTSVYSSLSIVCLSFTEGFWLPLWYIQAFLLSDCRRLKASDYHFVIFKPFYCLSVVDWRLLITTLVYSSLSIVCLSSIEGFWLPLWYIQAFILSVCRPLKVSYYHFGIFKPFYCLSVVDWRLLITTLVYSSLSIVCLSSIEGFWLPLWYIQAFLLSVCLSSIEGFWLPLWYIQAFLLSVCCPLKASDYHFDIFKPFYCLFVVDWKLLITTLVYSSLFIVCLSGLKASDYHFGIFKPFYCLSVVHWRLLVTTLVYSSLSIVCLSSIEGFWLPLWYIQAFLLSVCRRLKASDYHFGIFKPFYCLSVVHWTLLITTLVYSSLSIVCLSSIEGFWLPLWYIQAFLLSVCLDWRLLITTLIYSSLSIVCLSRLKASDYHFGILKPFYCLSVVDWGLLITTLVYSSFSIVCLLSIEGFWLPLWYIQAFLLSVCRRLKASDYHFGIFKLFYSLSVVHWRLLITTLVYSSLSIVWLSSHWRLLITTLVYSSLSIVCLSSIEGFWLPLWYIQAFLLSVCRRLKASDYHFGIFKPFYCLSVVHWRLLITTLIYSSLSIVCLSSIEGFWLPLWYIQAFLLSVCRPLKASDYHFGIFKPCYCLSVVDWRLLITTLVYSSLSNVCLSRLKASDYHFDIFKPFYCLSVVDWRLLITTLVYSSLSIVCLSSIEGFWLLLWYIQAFLLSLCRRLKVSDYHYGIFKPFYCLSVCRPLKASDYHFGIFKPFYCLSVVHWRLLITTLIYSSLSIVCLSSIESFWLPLWYIQAFLLYVCLDWRLLITTLVYSSLSIVCLSSIEGFWLLLWYIHAFLLSVCRRLKASDYHFGIFKPFYCLSVVDWRLLITTLVYSSLSIVCLSSIERFWLPLWYIQAFLLSVCRRLKASDYHFGIFKPFYCLSVSIEGFWLPLWYIQAFLLSVCRRLKASDYHFGIFKPFYCLSVVHWRLLITTLVYSSLSIVWLSSIEGFWLPLWYIQAFLLSLCRRLKASDYHFGIFKPFYCLSVVHWRLLITTLIYSSLSIVCLSSIEGFWLPLWYIQAFILSVCRPLKVSYYHFGIFKPFYCLSVVDWRLLITTLVYSSLSIVCLSSIEGFWLPLWYIQAFLLSVCRPLKASDYHFDIFKPFYCLSVVDWRLLITTLVYSSLSIVCLSSIEGFWLPLWYTQALLLSVCRRLKASDYHFGIFKPFYCLSVSIEGFWLTLWYIQAFLLSVCCPLEASDYHFGILKPFYCLSVVDWGLLITTLVYSSFSIVCLLSIEGFWLPLWYIQAFLLSVCRRLKASDYHFDIFKLFYSLSVVHWRLLITTLVYSSLSIVWLSSHWRLLITTLVYSSLSIVCLSSIEGFWLPLWYIQALLLSVCRPLKASDYHFDIFKPFYCLSVVDWRLLITTLVYSSLSIVCLSSIEGFWLLLWYIQAFLLSVCRRLKASDYHFGIFKPFYCLSVVDWRLLITTLVYSCLSIVCLSSIEAFWLLLWYIQAFLLSVCRPLMGSDFHFDIFKPFYCLSVVDWRLLITTLVYSSLSIVCLSRLKASDYHFDIFKPFYCLSVVDWRLLITTSVYSSLSIVCLSFIEGFWLPLWYIQAFLLSDCRRLKASDYHFGIFKPFYCLSVVDWRLLITTLVYSSLSIVCLSSIEGFWLPLWYIQAFLLSVCRPLKASDYHFDIFKPFYCLSVVDWRLLITTLVYSSLYIVCLSSIEGFLLPLWYIQAFLLSVCRRLKASDYHFDLFKPFYCLSVVDWRLLITTLVYSSLSIVCLASIEGFWLPLWYIQAFLLSVCRRLKASDYQFGIFKPFYCLSVVHWRLLITTLVYSSLAIVSLSSIEGFWLPLWYIQAFLLSLCLDWWLLITTLVYSNLSVVCLLSIGGFWLPLWYTQAFLLSVCRRLRASDYHFDIFKPFYCLSVVDWRLLITTLVYSSLSIVWLSSHWRLLITTLVYSSLSIVCLSSIEGFWLPLWYIQAFLLSVCRPLKASDYHFDIFKPFYCLSVVDWRLLITTLVYSSLSIVCLASIEGFSLPLWYTQAFLLSVCRPLKASEYHFGILKPCYCLSVVDWRLLITTLVYSRLSIVCLSRLKAFDYHFDIFKPFYCLSVVDWRLLITTLVYSSLYIVCLSSIEGFWLPLWYIQAFLLSVCRSLKASDYHFGIFKPFYCLTVVDWRLLITTLVYSSLSIVWLSSIEGFWLPLWYIQAFLLSVCRPLKASDYHFGILKPCYCLSVVDWRLMITTLVYSSLSIVCLSSIEGFWLLLWYIQAFLLSLCRRLKVSDYHYGIFKPFYCLSVCRPLKASDYHFGIFKPFYCLSVVHWRLLITTLIYSSLSIVCLSSIEIFWLPLWYIQAFLLSVCRPLKTSDYHFGIFKPFYCLSVVDWRLLITTLVYSSLSIVCLSSIEGFWLPLWYIQAFLLSVCRRLKASDYYFGIFKPFYCLSVVHWWLLISTSIYSSLSIVCLSSIEGFWLPLWYIQAFLLSVCRPLNASDYHFGIFKPLYCLSVVDWRLLITTLVYSSLSIVCLSRLKASDYYFDIFKPFYCLSVVDWRLLITTLVYSSLSIVCLSFTEGFWLPLWYIQAFLLSLCRRLKASDYHFGIFKPFYCLSVVDWRLLITNLVYSSLSIVCLSSIEGFWLPLWYIQAFLLSVCCPLKASDYHFDIFKPFYCLSVVDWRLLITTLVYSSLYIVCLSSIEGFWLPLWYIQSFLLSVCRRLKASDYHFGIFKPFYCLSVVHWRLLITTLVYSSLAIVCLSSIEGFWLPLWYIQAFLLSVCFDWRLLITTLVYSSLSVVCLLSIGGFWLPLWYTQAFLLSVCRRLRGSDYYFGIFKLFYCLSVVHWRLLITTLVYWSLSIVCLSSIEGFWLPLWYIQAFLFSVCRSLKASDYYFGIFKPFYCLTVVALKASDYHFGIFKPFYCLSVVDWRLLITTLVYSSLSIVCLSSIEGFWLPLWYIQAFLLSVCRRLKASDYQFGIFKPFYCLSVVHWRLLITTLVYSSLSIVCLSSIEGFWLPLRYIQAFLLSVCRRLKASDYHFGIFKPFYCLSVVDWRLLITTLVYSSLSIVCLSSIEGFWLPLWYTQALLLSVCRRLKASDYLFGIFKPFYCLSVSIEGFWLPLWYIQAFLLSVCCPLEASDYHFGILKPFYCLSVVDWGLLITTLVYSSFSIVCLSSIEGFWLLLWYIQAFLLSVCRSLKASDYHFGIFKPFYCLTVVDWRLLITTLVYSSLSIVSLSSIEGFWLPLWYIQAFLLSVCRPLKASDYHFDIFKPFYCLSVVDWRLLITTLVYWSLSIVCLSSIEGFWLPLWYTQAWLLSVCRRLKASDYHFGIFKPFYCLSVSIEGFWLPLWYIQAFLLSVCRPLKASDNYFGIFKPFYCLSVVDWRLLITTIVYSSLSIVCLSSIEGFWLPLWYIQAFLLSVCCPLKASDYHFDIFKPFYCLSVVDWKLLITTLVYSSLFIVCLSRLKASDYHFGIFKPFYCLSVSIEGFWLLLWYIQAFLLSVCRRLKASDYHFGIFKPFYCLSVVHWRLLITTLVYSSLSIVWLSSIEGFWLPLWYIQAFLLSLCRRLKASDYHFGIFKPFYCLSVVHWRLLITTLVYSSLSIVCLLSIEGFWLPLWYIQAFLLSVCRRLKASDYHFGIFKPLYCLSVVHWRFLITTLVYSSLSIVCLSSIEGFWLPLWYIQAFLLSVCRRLKASHYHFGIFKPFYCLSVVHWRLLITTLIYSILSIVCLSSIEGFWLPLWYIQAFLLSVCRPLKASDYHFGILKPCYCLSVVDWRLLITTLVYSSLSIVCLFRLKASDYHFGIFKPFCCLSVVHWRLLITTLVYSSLSIVCLSSIEGIWLLLWYIQAFLLSVCCPLKASDYHFGILKPFYCLSVVDWRLLITTLVYSSFSILCLSFIEGFWLPLWYIQAFLLSDCRRIEGFWLPLWYI